MNNDIQQFRRSLERRKGQKNQVEQSIEVSQCKIKVLKEQEEHLQEANMIIATVAKVTQDELCFHIETLVSLALEAVFPDPYSMNLDFVLKRGKSEAELTFSRGSDEKIDPMTASGGGTVDVAAFALRVSLWSLKRPRTRNVILLDEPFRFLSRDLQSKASEMLQQISRKLGIQFIIITHEPHLLEHADRVFEVSLKKGKSMVVCQE